MEAERKPTPFETVDGEADRVREIFKHSFPASDDELDGLIPKKFTDTISRRAEGNQSPQEDFDWSVTLANVETIVGAKHANEALLIAAEKRAEIAEAKAKEAVHWLKVLHKAILKGLPDKVA